MRFLSALTTSMFRWTRDGRRVYGLPTLPGLPMSWYHVTDSATARVDRRFRRLFTVTVFVMIPAVAVLSWWVLLAAIALLWTPLAMRYWVLRDVPRTVVAAGDLVPIDRRARDLAQSQQMGEPMLWFIFAATILMAAIDVVVIVTDYVWWAWLGLVFFGAGAVYMARLIVLLRRARR